MDKESRILGQLEFASDNGKKYGIIKTPERTKSYVNLAMEKLVTNRLFLHEKFCSFCEELLPTDAIKEELKAQFLRMRYPEKDPENPRYRRGSKFAHGKWNGQSDDLLIAALMIIQFSLEFSAMHRTYESILERIKYHSSKESMYDNEDEMSVPHSKPFYWPQEVAT